MSGPGDRASKLASAQEPSLSTLMKATAPLRRMDVEGVLLPGSKEFGTFRESFVWKLGDLGGASPAIGSGRQPWESDKRYAAVVSLREVGRGHSTVEVGEDVGNARRVDGGKDRGQGEVRGTKRVLDTERDRRAHAHATDRGRSAGFAPRVVVVAPRWEPGAGNPLAGFCPGGGPKGPSLPGLLTEQR